MRHKHSSLFLQWVDNDGGGADDGGEDDDGSNSCHRTPLGDYWKLGSCYECAKAPKASSTSEVGFSNSQFSNPVFQTHPGLS